MDQPSQDVVVLAEAVQFLGPQGPTDFWLAWCKKCNQQEGNKTKKKALAEDRAFRHNAMRHSPRMEEIATGKVPCHKQGCKHPAVGKRFGHNKGRHVLHNYLARCACCGADPFIAWGRGTGFQAVIPIREAFARCTAAREAERQAKAAATTGANVGQ